MGEQSVEEAYEALDEAIHAWGSHMRSCRCELAPHVRTLLMAMLEEVDSSVHTVLLGERQRCRERLRARIEALGR